jgi:hypothetical protein
MSNKCLSVTDQAKPTKFSYPILRFFNTILQMGETRIPNSIYFLVIPYLFSISSFTNSSQQLCSSTIRWDLNIWLCFTIDATWCYRVGAPKVGIVGSELTPTVFAQVALLPVGDFAILLNVQWWIPQTSNFLVTHMLRERCGCIRLNLITASSHPAWAWPWRLPQNRSPISAALTKFSWV